LTLLVRDYMYYMSRQLEIMPVEHNFARLWLTRLQRAVFSEKIKADGNRVDVLKLKNR
jgi:hypothetical protein